MIMNKLFKKCLSTIMILTIIFTSSINMFASDVIMSNRPSNIADNTNGFLGSNRIYSASTLPDIYFGPNMAPADGIILDYYSDNNNNNNKVYDTYNIYNISTNSIINNVNNNNSNQMNIQNSISNMPTPLNTTSMPNRGVSVTGFSNTYIGNVRIQNGQSNTVDAGPTVREITSPAANEAALRSASNNASVIGNVANNAPTANGANTTSIAANNMQAAASAMAQSAYMANTQHAISYTVANVPIAQPNISAPCAILVNASTNQIYYSKGVNVVQAPASLVNILTAYLLITHKNVNDVLTVSARAVNNLEDGASTAGLNAGDTITVGDALAAMFVKSCCDVANVVAENVSGSIENFVTLMNQTAKSFGCMQSNFVNPSGLNNDAQVTTVHDMAIIMQKATDNPTLAQYMGLSKHTLPANSHRKALTIYSKNTLMSAGSSNYYPGIVSSRMGYTSKALYTIASLMLNNNQKLIAVVLHANGSQFSDTRKLFDFGKQAQLTAIANANTNSFNNSLSGFVTTAPNSLNSNFNASNIGAVVANTAINLTSNGQGQWVKDNIGWTFIKSNGQKAINEWIELNGKRYCVDATGHMITGWRDFSNGKTYYFDTTTGELKHNTWLNLSNGSYYLKEDGSLAKASSGTENITTSVGTYTIDSTGKAIAKVS